MRKLMVLSLVVMLSLPAIAQEATPMIEPLGPVTKPVAVRQYVPRESKALASGRNRYTYLNWNCGPYGYGYGPGGYSFLYNYYSCRGLLPFGSFGWGFWGPSY